MTFNNTKDNDDTKVRDFFLNSGKIILALCVCGLFGFIIVSGITSSDLDNVCRTNNSSLIKKNGQWTCFTKSYGGMWHHNRTGTELNFAVDGTFYSLFFTNATHLNGFSAEGISYLGASNLTAEVGGVYLANYMASGDGQNNHVYATSVFVNGVNQLNCENEHKMAAGGDIITQSGTCIIEISVGDKVSLRTADIGSTGTGNYYSSNLDLVRVF